MSLDRRFIGAISEDDEKILNKFLHDTGIKKSKLIRNFIRSLEDIDPDTMEIIVADKNHVRSMALVKSDGFKAKEINNRSNLELYSDIPYSITITSNGKGMVSTTKIIGDDDNV